MSSKREQITAYVNTQIAALSQVKSVTREPKSLEELSRAAFPHVLIQTANESREHYSFGDNQKRIAELEVVLQVVVHGADRDQQRNTVIEVIEERLEQDPSFGGICQDSFVSEIQVSDVAEAAPYAQAAIVIKARYVYTRGDA